MTNKKFLIIGDPHLDSKEELIDDKINLLEHYFEKYIFDVCIFLGDMFHNRKNVSVHAVKRIQELIKKYNHKEFIIIVGNHDCRHFNTINPNSVKISLRKFNNVTIIDEPKELYDFIFIPWMCEDNYDKCIEFIHKTDKKYCCGHFAINGFEAEKGFYYKTGLESSLFKKFDKIFSGHFHLYQDKKNIYYIGSLYQERWSDYGDIKSICLFENDSFEIIKSDIEIYKHLNILDEKTDFNVDDYKNCHIKIYHYKKLSKKQYEKLNELYSVVKSYKLFDETEVDIKDVVITKLEFDDIVDEYFKEIESDEKEIIEDVVKYLKKKNQEI